MPRAKITETRIVRLGLVVLERAKKGTVLHDGVVYLGSEKCAAVIHYVSN
jgi:hypothetical protein